MPYTALSTAPSRNAIQAVVAVILLSPGVVRCACHQTLHSIPYTKLIDLYTYWDTFC
jgi:hypothetical protein